MEINISKLSYKDIWKFALIMFIIYLFVSCCISDISSAYKKVYEKKIEESNINLSK